MENFGHDETSGVGVIISQLKERGYRLIIKKAYADWGQFAAYKRSMLEHSIELTEMPSHKGRGKNGADIKLAIDALEAAIFREYIQIFVIVSGDSDFTALLSKLREYNKYVIVIARTEACSDLLKGYCDELINYDARVKRPAQQGKPRPKDRYDLLRSAILALEAQNAQARASLVKSRMLVMDPAFNETVFGFQQFKQYLAAAERDGVIRLTPHRDGDQGISLLGGGNGAGGNGAGGNAPGNDGAGGEGVTPTATPVRSTEVVRRPQTTKARELAILVLRACRAANCGQIAGARTDIVGAICRRLDPDFDLVAYGGSKSQGFVGLVTNHEREGFFRVGRKLGEDHPWVDVTPSGVELLQTLPFTEEEVAACIRQALVQLQLPVRWDSYVTVVDVLRSKVDESGAVRETQPWSDTLDTIAAAMPPAVAKTRMYTIAQILKDSRHIVFESAVDNEGNVFDTMKSMAKPEECLCALLDHIRNRMQQEKHLMVEPIQVMDAMEATDDQIGQCLGNGGELDETM